MYHKHVLRLENPSLKAPIWGPTGPICCLDYFFWWYALKIQGLDAVRRDMYSSVPSLPLKLSEFAIFDFYNIILNSCYSTLSVSLNSLWHLETVLCCLELFCTLLDIYHLGKRLMKQPKWLNITPHISNAPRGRRYCL